MSAMSLGPCTKNHFTLSLTTLSVPSSESEWFNHDKKSIKVKKIQLLLQFTLNSTINWLSLSLPDTWIARFWNVFTTSLIVFQHFQGNLYNQFTWFFVVWTASDLTLKQTLCSTWCGNHSAMMFCVDFASRCCVNVWHLLG